MRILQIVNIGFEAGGAEKSVRLIARGLSDRGHHVRVLATDLLSADQRVFADELVPAISGNAAQRLARKFWYQRAYRQVGTAVRDFRPDCVHLHTIGEFSPSVLAATASCRRVLTVHGPEDWTGSLLRWNLAGAAAGRLSAADRARYAYLRFLQRPAYLPRLRRVDRVLAPSRYFADAVRADVGSVPVHVVPNGIESTVEARPLREFGHVVFVGRLERVKGVEVLLRAFRELAGAGVLGAGVLGTGGLGAGGLGASGASEPVTAGHPGSGPNRGPGPHLRLTVVGDGTDRARLAESAADLVAAGSVVFRGWLPQEEVRDCLEDASVVVLPSLWPENFPTVALEALQMGRPLIASRVGGLPELVGDDNGALVPAGDVPALAAALDGLLDHPEALRAKAAASAVRAARYGVAEFLDALEHHYREAAAG
jgi:glycosyltransferase involved in cell wall biosynthesis